MIKGVFGALVGGAIGAAIWAAISHYTHYEIGWIAWGIGAMVGVGMAAGCGNKMGLGTGILAGSIAAASVGVGKFAVVHLIVTKVTQSATQIHFDADKSKVYMADQLVEEYTTKGKELKWPEGKTAENADVPSDYPKDLWKDVEARWTAMAPDAQQAYSASAEADVHERMGAAVAEIETRGFLASFGLFDLLWFGLAIVTAFKIGSGMQSGAGDED